jgi:NTE family protein
MSTALVLGGGGVAGIAWTTGLLRGLAEAGLDAAEADLVVGTSAGATVGAQLGSGLGLDQLYARQVEPDLQAPEIDPGVDLRTFADGLGVALRATGSPRDVRRAIGELALRAQTVDELVRRAVIESRLPSHAWPARTLRIVAVDARSGDPRVFDKTSGVDLVDAVAASCAVPGIWPPVEIAGRHYVDGGVRSNENADYAKGASRVLVVAPLGTEPLVPGEMPLEQAVAVLRAGGAEVAIVLPDEASRAVIGTSPLDPTTRTPAAAAGWAQGRATKPAWR